MDRRVCLPHAATAAFEVQSAPAYALIITVLTEPMTPMTVHAPHICTRTGLTRPHLHRKLLHRAFKVRLRGISPETRRVCMRARVRQRAQMHARLCVQGCVSVCARASGCVCACAQRSGGLADGATMRRSGPCVEGSEGSKEARRWRCRHCPWPSIPHPVLHCHICAGTRTCR